MGAQPVYNEEDPNILDAFGSFEEMKVLLDRASETYEYRQVFYQGQTFSHYPVAGGANNVVTTPANEASAVLPIGTESDELRWVYGTAPDSLTAPITAGQKITYIEIWYRDLCIAQTDLLAVNDVDIYVAPSEPEMPAKTLLEEGGKITAVVLGVILGVAVLIVLILFVIRYVRISAIRTRRRRRNRRSR